MNFRNSSRATVVTVVARVLAGLLSIPAGVAVASTADLVGAQQVIERVDAASPVEARAQSDGAELLADVRAFRAVREGEPAELAKKWFELFDRASATKAAEGDYGAYDVDVGRPAGVASTIAAIPPPEAWPAMRELAKARAKARPDDVRSLALRLLTELLASDTKAAGATLDQIERAAARLDDAERKRTLARVASERTWLAATRGSRAEAAAAFQHAVEAFRAGSGYEELVVPDLVGLLGEERARALLVRALREPVALLARDGEATRRLAREVALSNVATMARPQWGLVDAPEATELYEAITKRFVVGSTAAGGRDYASYSMSKPRADLMYVVGLIAAGRNADAEKKLVELAERGRYDAESELSLPREVVDALRRAGQDEPLRAFLHDLLLRRPETDAWTLYLAQAATTGRLDDALQLIVALRARTDVPHVASRLRRAHIDALLALDRVEPALAEARAVLEAPPTATDKDLASRVALALRVAALGRLLEDESHARLGTGFVTKAVRVEGKADAFDRASIVTNLSAELRRQSRPQEAQQLAIAEIQRARKARSGYEALNTQRTGESAALVELVGIYGAAGRHQDVLALLDGAGGWGADDLADVALATDSLGVPLGLAAARAMAALGDTPAALATLRVVLDGMPAYDPAFELYTDLAATDAIDEFERRYARDRFEERPLIWKGVALTAAGRYPEAELAIKAAIAIDPSDGEQGANDRMRAYAVLASILEAKDDAEGAALYRGAVRAIRMSEVADEFNKLGLYRRAIEGYDAGLEAFSEAYCIQSRLAVQLSKTGRHQEALAHYRRAYELMPGSFGRVESHCFGCESVFADPSAQGIAEQVFTEFVKKTPEKPQAHYMLGYLRKEQGRWADALQGFRDAVARDGEYLNAWRQLHELSQHTYIEPAERDIAVLKLLELDPRQRHVRYELDRVTDLRTLWRAVAAVEPEVRTRALRPLERSAREQADAHARLPEETRMQMALYLALSDAAMGMATDRQGPGATLARHQLVSGLVPLLGETAESWW